MSQKREVRADILVGRYLSAKRHVVSAGYASEIDWQDERRLEKVTESTFLLETAWVILSSGMREAVIRQRFPLISKAFLGWSSASAIVNRRRMCRRAAMAAFGHGPKIDAIISSADLVAKSGVDRIKLRIRTLGAVALQEFPFVGPITAWHLAKNLGLDVVKPDRHLCRISHIAGFASPVDMCQLIADHVGDRLSVIDMVLWRFATLRSDYCRFFDRHEPASNFPPDLVQCG